MGTEYDFRSKITILVNSCDAYEDLWSPFFSLFKKYCPIDAQIILNTESKDVSVDGLDIKCVHPSRPDDPYGKRMRHALKQVKTRYVLLLLDDFYLRSPVDLQRLDSIMEWMDKDPNIACFNSEPTSVYTDLEVERYPGFRRVPLGTPYTLNMQAAIWRTSLLGKYWRSNITPWEWENYCNVLTTKYPRDKFYCATCGGSPYMDYGHYQVGDLWGVVRGKWFLPDIAPLFDREGIHMDLSVRGAYYPPLKQDSVPIPASRTTYYSRIYRCLGSEFLLRYLLFCGMCHAKKLLGSPVRDDYYAYLLNKAKVALENEEKSEK